MKQFRYNEYMLFRLPKDKPLGNTALVRNNDDILEWQEISDLSSTTDLTITKTSSNNTIINSNGTGVIISLADSTNAGLLSPSEKIKLATVLLSTGNLDGLSNTATARINLGIGNINNTSDANKPVSIAQQNALNLKVDKVTGKGLSTNDFTNIIKTDYDNHLINTNNPHNVTKEQLGLSSVNDTSDLNKPISTATQSALNNKADLVGGFIPASQIPGSYDDVIDVHSFVTSNPTSGMTTGFIYYNTITNQLFTATSATTGTSSTPEAGKIYIKVNDLTSYRWSGSVLAPINAGLALGITSGTAYRGDYGNVAYLHSQITDGSNPHGTTFANLVNKPTSISGYGIINAYTKTEIDTFTSDFVAYYNSL